ncbi:MAG: phage/plasmid primase, P4 family, partial [Xenococcus sp. (in: cyanobacteria)]
GTSFTVYPDKGFFDAGGNFSGSPMDYIHSIKIGYYERAKRKDWVNALKELANIAGVEFPDKFNNSDSAQKWLNRQNILTHAYEYLHNALLNPNNWKAQKALEYLHSRGINDKTIKTLKIGFYDSWAGINNYLAGKGFTPDEVKAVGLQRGKFITKDGVIDSKNNCTWVNFITFPWLDVNGNPLSLYGRYFEKKPPNTLTPKTLALPGSHTKKHPFLFNICKENNHKEVIFVEGLFDAIVLYQSGITNVCSGIGASFSNEQINCLSNHKINKVTQLGDPDGGGENGTKSNLKRLLKKGIDVIVPEKLPDKLDPDEFVNKYGIDSLKERFNQAEHGLVWLAKLTVNQFNNDDNNFISQCLNESAKLEREYLKVGVNSLLWHGYYTKTLKSILDIDEGEFKVNFDLEREKVAEKVIETLEAVEQWEPYEISLRLSEKYRDILAYDGEIQEWRRYGAEYNGVWSIEDDWSVANVIGGELYNLSFKFKDFKTGDRPNISHNFVNGILGLLKSHLGKKKWDKADPKLLPLLNGVVDLRTKQLIPHCPGNNLTWVLPYEYDPVARCTPILEWLNEMAKDENIVQLIRAYFRAIVTGRSDLHKFIELLGAGGTGKSTVLRLATALIGRINTHTTTLDVLEKNQFENASLADKRLLLITDSERYGGGVATLKALTGGDSIRFEQKYKQSKGGFNPKILVMMASNEQVQSSDYTSGLSRRKITIPFNNKIPDTKHRQLIEVESDLIYGEFADYIPGLLNWVLGMSDDEMVSYLKDTDNQVPYLNEQKLESLLDSNPLADWANLHLILSEGTKSYVGIKTGNQDHQLYASYCNYMENSGSRPVAIRRFSSLLSDLFNYQLNIPIKKYRDSSGAYFMDISVRHCSDTQPLLITGNYTHLESSNTPCTESPPHNSTPKNSYCESLASDFPNDGKNDGKMMAESTGSVESDGSDGKIEKSLIPEERSSTDLQKSENLENLEICQHNHQNQHSREVQPSDLPSQGDNFAVTENECCSKWDGITRDDLAPIDQIIQEYKEGLWDYIDDEFEGLLNKYPMSDLMRFWAEAFE